ncbi:E3 ubiquitin-protein ligase MARCHF9 isoform X2 [Crotalus tigris]|uniref:E3 ubiquitin-protein ligase MARCHF9 isoform X2 n=1 Tax=Crotalus tigris TaxID=88082 RepID=UPI00192F356B|nr:E3 ubiquitin-protein ligase MARCHF9 isoform X2 [Crotalus tigris]
MMFKYRIRMFFNELKLLVLMRRGRPEPEPGAGGSRGALGGSGCGWPPFADCSVQQDDEAEYYGGGGAETRPRSLALEEKDPRLQPPGHQPGHQPTAGGAGGALDSVSLSSSLDSGMRTPQCRICFQGPEQGELLSPCRCDGSVRCTHQPCLIRWISERGSWSCELCYFKYQVLAISTKNPLQWQAISLTVIEKVQIAAIILGSLFLIASISWLIWSSLSPSAKWQRQDLLFQICYGMYGFMDIVCIGGSSWCCCFHQRKPRIHYHFFLSARAFAVVEVSGTERSQQQSCLLRRADLNVGRNSASCLCKTKEKIKAAERNENIYFCTECLES